LRARRSSSRELALDHVDEPVEGVAHRPGLSAWVVELARTRAAVVHGLLRALAGGGEALLQVERGALVHVVAGREMLLVVDGRAHLDRLADDAAGALEIDVGAAREELEIVV